MVRFIRIILGSYLFLSGICESIDLIGDQIRDKYQLDIEEYANVQQPFQVQ